MVLWDFFEMKIGKPVLLDRTMRIASFCCGNCFGASAVLTRGDIRLAPLCKIEDSCKGFPFITRLVNVGFALVFTSRFLASKFVCACSKVLHWSVAKKAMNKYFIFNYNKLYSLVDKVMIVDGVVVLLLPQTR